MQRGTTIFFRRRIASGATRCPRVTYAAGDAAKVPSVLHEVLARPGAQHGATGRNFSFVRAIRLDQVIEI
jgi:hypothetical protein